MAQHSSIDHDSEHAADRNAGFPFLPVIISAIILLAGGAFLLNLGVSGGLPTGFGLGDSLPASMVAGVDLDIVRGIVIVIVLAVIAVGSFMVLRNNKG
jgi:hypothetical protein